MFRFMKKWIVSPRAHTHTHEMTDSVCVVRGLQVNRGALIELVCMKLWTRRWARDGMRVTESAIASVGSYWFVFGVTGSIEVIRVRQIECHL